MVQPGTSEPIPGHHLTPRECEDLALLAMGLSNPEIGQKLHIRRATVRTHVSSILSKLGVSNRGEGIALAIEHKLVD